MAETNETMRKAIGFGSIGFGVFGVLAPSAFASTYGLASSTTTNIFIRLFGTRSLALGALTVGPADDETRRRLLTLSTAMNVLDTVIVATASGVPTRSRVTGAATTAAFGGLGAYLLSQS